jgi:RNA polymerase sigma-70 factor (ECF subfamily)
VSLKLATPSLEQVFVANRHQLQMIARKITGSQELADDVMQDAYLRLRQGECAREIHNPLYYCNQVVRNVALDYYRRQAVEASYRVFTDDGELPPVVCPSRVDKDLHDRRILDAVVSVLEGLPPRIRQVFELYRLAGLTQREIGKHLGCSATLVNFMMKEAMEALSMCRVLMDGD